ncbi:hypothetical protein ISS86_02910 [Candidatus Microgenomates bacterium]|nr:hypothetical protein [Candidatus Microgenomates bacterium]
MGDIGMEGPAGGTLISLAPYFISLAFMFIGFLMSLRINAMGVKGLTAGVKRGSTVAGKVLGKRMWTDTKDTFKGFAKGAVGAVAGSNIRKTYKVARAAGLPPHKAAGEAIKRQWVRRTIPAVKRAVTTKEGRKEAGKAILRAPWTATKLTGRATLAVAKETWSAVKDSAKAGWKAGWKMKKKKKGEKCPQCKGTLPNDADYCPHCGYKF